MPPVPTDQAGPEALAALHAGDHTRAAARVRSLSGPAAAALAHTAQAVSIAAWRRACDNGPAAPPSPAPAGVGSDQGLGCRILAAMAGGDDERSRTLLAGMSAADARTLARAAQALSTTAWLWATGRRSPERPGSLPPDVARLRRHDGAVYAFQCQHCGGAWTVSQQPSHLPACSAPGPRSR